MFWEEWWQFQMLSFEWDEDKNRINQKKHKVLFEEAKAVFYDERALVINDPGILRKKKDSLFSEWVPGQICWSSAIAIDPQIA